MIRSWVKLLPFFIVEWLAKYGERYEINLRKDGRPDGVISVVRPFHGVYIDPDNKQRRIDQGLND